MADEEVINEDTSLLKITGNKERNEPIHENDDKSESSILNLGYCKISLGIIAAYTYIISSIGTNIINRVLFLQYDFKFDYSVLFLQQLSCAIFYIILSWKSKSFRKSLGELSFKDFWKLKYKYLGYSLFFLILNLMGYIGYQIVTNIPMYVNLRKLVTAMTFIYQYFFKKKKISKINIIVVILLTIGAILSGIDDYTTDILGYLVIFIINIMSVMNLEISENFKKQNGISNIKLLAYNSFILPPVLIICIFLSGEFNLLTKYFSTKHNFTYFGLFFNLVLSCSVRIVDSISFFISNEKIKSLLTQILSDTKYIIVTLLSYFILKTFSFTWKNGLGLSISTLAAVIITINSMYENIEIANANDKTGKKYDLIKNIDLEKNTIEFSSNDNLKDENDKNIINNIINSKNEDDEDYINKIKNN